MNNVTRRQARNKPVKKKDAMATSMVTMCKQPLWRRLQIAVCVIFKAYK